jgi:serine protease Do
MEIGNRLKVSLTRSILAPVLAVAMVASFATYEFAKPVAAHASVAANAATPLDDNSVGALLSLDKAMETLAAKVTPTVVNVAVTSRGNAHQASADEQDPEDFPGFGQFFGQGRGMRPQRPEVEHGIGSGVVISPDGYIVTNNHVVEGAMDIRVTTSDKRVWSAKLIGTDPLTDLAVIKVNATNLPSMPWGNSADLHPGQTVLAFGNPMGMRFTVTRGIVSALNRPNPFADDARKPGGYIQTDAAINPGNSGGALVNAHGELVGINTFLLSRTGGFSGMGFAIPTQIVKPIVNSLVQYGKVNHAYMGVGISDVTPENAKFFHLNDNNGAVVTQVEPNSPGAQAGLKTGDVIRSLDGKPVEDATQLQVAVQEKRPDTKVNLEVLRDGKPMKVSVTLQAMDKGQGATAGSANEEQGKARWGIGLSDMTPDLREQLQVPSDVKGAVVGRVRPGSPADNAGLSQGDVIVEVNRQPVQTAADAKKALTSVGKGQDALVLIWSQGGNTFRVLRAPEAS